MPRPFPTTFCTPTLCDTTPSLQLIFLTLRAHAKPEEDKSDDACAVVLNTERGPALPLGLSSPQGMVD